MCRLLPLPSFTVQGLLQSNYGTIAGSQSDGFEYWKANFKSITALVDFLEQKGRNLAVLNDIIRTHVDILKYSRYEVSGFPIIFANFFLSAIRPSMVYARYLSSLALPALSPSIPVSLITSGFSFPYPRNNDGRVTLSIG